MSIVIRYIVLNDKISCLEEHGNKLLFLYNYRSYYKLKWLIYAWAPLPDDIKRKIINIYSITNLFLTGELLKNLLYDYKEIIDITIKDINEKTFIKFLYDLKYINKNLLLLFNSETKAYPNNPGFVLDKEKAAQLLSRSTSFDYLNGKVLKINFQGGVKFANRTWTPLQNLICNRG